MSPYARRHLIDLFLVWQLPGFFILGLLLVILPASWTNGPSLRTLYGILGRREWGFALLTIVALSTAALWMDKDRWRKSVRNALSWVSGSWSVALLLPLCFSAPDHNALAWIPWAGLLSAHVVVGVVDEYDSRELRRRGDE